MSQSLQASAWPLQELLSHRPPMIFINRVVEADQKALTAEVRIEPGVPLYQEGIGVPAWVGLEYMAQSVAALSGFKARTNDDDVPLGLLIGCRKYVSEVATFPKGTNLKIRVIELDGIDESLGAYDCTIGDPDTIVLARLLVYARTQDGDDKNSAMKMIKQ